MRRATVTAIGVIAMVMMVSAWSAAEAPTGTISGLVIGAEGQGLPGATVVVVASPDGPSRVVVTGAGGVFRASGLPAGVYTVDVQVRGFHPSVIADVEVWLNN